MGTIFDSDWRDANSRTLRNSTVSRWEEAGQPAWGERPNEHDTIAITRDGRSITRYSPSSPTADVTGDIGEMALYAGQGVGLVERAQSAGEIVNEMADQAVLALASMRGLVEAG